MPPEQTIEWLSALRRTSSAADGGGFSAAARTEQILDSAWDAFIAMGADGCVTGWNRQAEDTFGWTRAEALGRDVAQLIIPERYRAAHYAGVRRFLATGKPHVIGQRLELAGLRRSGEEFPIEITFWAHQAGPGWAFYAFARDITASKARDQREAELTHRTLHDELTGLANRALIVDLIDKALAAPRGEDSRLAVLRCDLDRFKVINDSLGHNAGDHLLQAVAARLCASVGPRDTVARIAGDEFVVLSEGLAGADPESDLAARILAALHEPIDVGHERYRAQVSIGIALAGPGAGGPGTVGPDAVGPDAAGPDAAEARADDAEDLLRHANAALTRAKGQGGGRSELFDQEMRAQADSRLHTELDLAACVGRGELRLHYQPIVSLSDGRTVGVEALVRWQHPTRGLLGPGEFIPLGEETGAIVQIGTWVLQEACRQAAVWQAQGVRGMAIAVNLSTRQLSQAGFVPTVAEIIGRAQLDPEAVRIDFEVTESLLMRDPRTATKVLHELRNLGARLSIDDFGTGHSSLAYLRDLPVNAVKIDRSFITCLEADPRQVSLVKAIAELGHALGLTVLAEGVEVDGQRAELLRIGCDLAQGFYYSRPVPAEQLTLDATVRTCDGR